MSYATSLDRLKEGTDRLHAFIARRSAQTQRASTARSSGPCRSTQRSVGTVGDRRRRLGATRRASRWHYGTDALSAVHRPIWCCCRADAIRSRRWRALCQVPRAAVVRGAGTGYTGGAVPSAAASSCRWNASIGSSQIDEDNLLAVVQPNVADRRAAGRGRGAWAVLSTRPGEPLDLVAGRQRR